MNDPKPELLPIPMVLFCPVCQMQHIDAPKPEIGWADPPHKSHECQGCKNVWRPCDLATTGVKEITTRGKADTWPVAVARMDAPDGPGPTHKQCICPFGILRGDCSEHGYLVP